MAKTKLTTAHFITKSTEKHGDFYDYSSSEYTGAHNFLYIICPAHGKFRQRAGDHMNVGKGCKLCGTARAAKPITFTTEDFLIKAKEKHDDNYDYSLSDYTSYKKPITIICKTHGAFSQAAGKHLKGYGCIKCGRTRPQRKRNKPPEKWISDFVGVHGNLYDYSEVVPVKKAKDRINILCRVHGMFQQTANVHLRGHGCPKCPHSRSKPEDELYEWLLPLLPNTEVVRGDRSAISPYELDILVPEFKVAIEFNGTYWHMEGNVSKDYHQKKSLLCREQGITLIHIYEYDWTTHKDKYKNIISAKMGVLLKKLDARKLKIKEVNDCRQFLEENHFQGFVASSKQFGLFDGETMVALMTFGKPRYTENNTWELLRFCSLTGTQVRGGAGRLFKHFVTTHLQSGESVISYARIDYSSGTVYEKLGFVLDGMSKPSYVWLSPSGRKVLPRYSTQKHKLAKLLGTSYDASLSESTNMKNAKYRRVYTAGNLRYIYRHADS